MLVGFYPTSLVKVETHEMNFSRILIFYLINCKTYKVVNAGREEIIWLKNKFAEDMIFIYYCQCL